MNRKNSLYVLRIYNISLFKITFSKIHFSVVEEATKVPPVIKKLHAYVICFLKMFCVYMYVHYINPYVGRLFDWSNHTKYLWCHPSTLTYWHGLNFSLTLIVFFFVMKSTTFDNIDTLIHVFLIHTICLFLKMWMKTINTFS